MQQISFIDPVDKGKHSAIWWAGNWQCRNWNGYLQSREGGKGPWQFTVYASGDADVVIYGVDNEGDLYHRRVVIDGRDRLLLNGRRYGRSHWRH